MQRVLLCTIILAGAVYATASSSQAADQPPLADAGPDRTVLTGERIIFDGTSSTDRNGNILEYRWDFSDGAHAIGITPHHVFWRPGAYRVKLTVKDDSGLAGNIHTDITVVTVNRRPNIVPKAQIALIGTQSARVGEPITFDGSKSSDPDGNILTHEWDFGNGAKARGVAPLFTYQQEGQYNVTLKVTDDYGDPAGTHQTQISINVKPRAVAKKAKE